MPDNDPSRYVQRQPSGIYRYYRRVPLEVAAVTGQWHVKVSLKTRVHRVALEKADRVHTALCDYWLTVLASNDNATATEQYLAAVRTAQSLGFTYRPITDDMDPDDAAARTVAAHERRLQGTAVRGILGTAVRPEPRVSDLWALYAEHNAAGLTGMSPGQAKLHKGSRERAIQYLIGVLGDVQLSSISRGDVLRYRDWWVERIAADGLKAYTPRRSFSDIMGMLSVIDDALQTEFRAPWRGVRFRETNLTKLDKRLPFPVEWVRDRLLAPGALDGMNDDARLIVYTMIETGMRLGEVCNLRPEDIRAGAVVPHVEVADRTDRRQKTDYSVRQIPLVGVSLWAVLQRPKGFARYADKANSASAAINKFLRGRGLLPSAAHTVYSLRHTFQDRIENAGASDRMQADLMGHEFGRPKYGDGAELVRRRDFLESIRFPWGG